MELKLIQVVDEEDYKEFKLYNEMNEVVTSFDVEIDKETALISYDTKEQFRRLGFASLGLNLLKETLSNDDSILFFELIHLSGEYSRKVAENAGFFSRSNNLEYWVALNPRAEEIVNAGLRNSEASSIQLKKLKRNLEKISSLRQSETKAKEKMLEKLEQLLQEKELVEPGEYKDSIEAEINHIQKIVTSSKEKEQKEVQTPSMK